LGTTRLIGYPIDLPHGQGQVWAINGNDGNVYLFTTDGLFVATLFHEYRDPASSWANVLKAERNMSISERTLGAECFWPSLTQTGDGKTYIQFAVGSSASLARIDGLDTIQRLPAQQLTVTSEELVAAQATFAKAEALRQKSMRDEPFDVSTQVTASQTLAGPDGWANANWITVDKRVNVKGWDHSDEIPKAAVAIIGDRLHVAYQTDEPNLLLNSGVSFQNLFKTGGGLDLMLDAVPGGERLLVAQVGGKTAAVLYRPKDASVTSSPLAFSSPLRTVMMDRVEDVSSQVDLVADGKGFFEYSVPLSVLGLPANQVQPIKADIGLLRGDGVQTLQRVYWHNKATGMVSDVPSEAELTPDLWGTLRFTGK
jgi:hypothetical protein